MGFAEERVFEHILRNLDRFRHIHVSSLAQSLSCLTEADRDELQAREEARGSQAAVFKFYQFLKCRRGWVADLILALHRHNAGHLAEELQRVYDRHRGPSAAPGSTAGAPGLEVSADTRAPTDGSPHRDAAFLPRADGKESSAADRAASAPSTASESSTSLGSSTASDSSIASESSTSLGSSMASDSSTASDSRIPVQESLPKETEMLPGGPASTELGGAAARAGQGWPGRQQHPVCVDDGYFGNARHLSRGGAGGSLPAPRSVRRNEPEEVHFVSAELQAAELLGGSGPVRGSLHNQQQLQAEPKRPELEREGDGASGSTRGGARVDPAPPAASSSCSGSLKTPVAAGEALAGQQGGSAPSVPVRGEVHPASTAAFPGSPAGAAQALPSDATADTELSKPGVLLSIADGHPAFSVPSGPYSGDTGRLQISSDPLLLSTDSSSSYPAPAPRADPREEEATGAGSRPPPTWDGASLRTHELRVEHCPSVPLGAPLEGDGPLGDPAAFVSASSSLPQGSVPAGDVEGSSLSYFAPAAGIALLSALAFLVYSRLQK